MTEHETDVRLDADQTTSLDADTAREIDIDLNIVQPTPIVEKSLARFFERLAADPAAAHFHPHSLTAEQAKLLCSYKDRDYYCVVVQGITVIAYGMLRGWESGYAIPSLGIAVDKQWRGYGLGRVLMNFLKLVAENRKAPKIRLKVYPDNEPAVKLYTKLGYKFNPELEDGQLVGYLDLGATEDIKWPELQVPSDLR